MSTIKKVSIAVLLLGLGFCAYFSYFVYQAVFAPNTKFETPEIEFFVATNDSYSLLLKKLNPLVKNVETLNQVARKKGYASNIKPGRYILKQGMNNNALINTLRSGNKPVKVSFNNQERLENLAGRISKQIEPDSIALLHAMLDTQFLEKTGFNVDNTLAMYLANSYEFYWNTGAADFCEKMYQEYLKFWTKERLSMANNIDLTPIEVINLASIVHKETVKIDERPRVAGVYLNRLKLGMMLQADPTVIYAIKKSEGNYDRIIKRVLNKDLELDSPYNTYQRVGIPPGPIVMPDLSAIDAVLNPEKHDFLYFVADVKRVGYHQFAKTLEQHNANKRAYVQWINQMGIYR